MNDTTDSSKEARIFSRLIDRYAIELPERLALESKQDFIYLSDLDTYELYLISMKNPEELLDSLKDYKGKKCYEVLQGRSSPCPFCTNHLLQKEVDYIWKKHNEIVHADYMLKDRLVTWNGKTVRMEVVIDVSDPQRIENVLQRTLTNQNVMTACVRHMLQAADIQQASEYILQQLCSFFESDGAYIRCRSAKNVRQQWVTENAPAFKLTETVDNETVENWNDKLLRGRQIIIRDTDEIRNVDEEAWQALDADQTRSLCVTPIYISNRLVGLIYLRNVTRHWTELSLLTMISSFVSMMIERETLEQEKRRLQYYDAVAQCQNFHGFRIAAETQLQESADEQFALWYCDIKGFKLINDVFGYDVGDRLLQCWAGHIKQLLKKRGVFGRVAGDNFAILCKYQGAEDLYARFTDMVQCIAAFEPIAAHQYRIDISAGVYLTDESEGLLSIDEMLNRANMAQKTVKHMPGSHLSIYNESVRRRVLREVLLKASMQDALRKQEFKMYLQPQVAMFKGSVIRAEALVRWQRSDGTLLQPSEFIALFERDGLIVDLDRYVFEHACQFECEWFDMGKIPLCISVNVSRISMLQPSFVEEYCRIKKQYNIPDGMIELEFTETIVIENYERFREIVSELRAAGFLCAMDDFGTNQSSLNLLRNLPLDVLKLDRLFFMEDDNADRGKAIVNCVLQLAHALHMYTVAEGIETMSLVEELRDMGCHYIQGFVFAHPMPAESFLELTEREILRFMGL